MSSVNPVKKFLERKLGPKLTRKEFAEQSGIPYSTVNRLLSIEYLSPNITTIYAIAKYFKCSMDEVVGRKKNLREVASKKSLSEFNNKENEDRSF